MYKRKVTKLFLHNSVNQFTSEKYMSVSLRANSRMRIAESSADLSTGTKVRQFHNIRRGGRGLQFDMGILK